MLLEQETSQDMFLEHKNLGTKCHFKCTGRKTNFRKFVATRKPEAIFKTRVFIKTNKNENQYCLALKVFFLNKF